MVVVSAMGRTTDHLIQLAQRTVPSPSPRELDMLLTTGERVSMSLLAMALEANGVPAISFTGSQSGILTDHTHNEAQILDIRPHRIQEALNDNKAVIIAGFQGVSPSREITTLGRGGSDTTAVALAAALGAQECVIFTDVEGLMTADPRLVEGARLIPRLDYDQALELAHLGAKMHPRSLDLARRHRVRLVIRSSRFDKFPGTLISEEEKVENPDIRGIATQSGYSYWEVEATLPQIATATKKTGITLRFFHATPRTVRFLCKSDFDGALRKALEAGALTNRSIADVAVVSAVGHGLSANPEILSTFLGALGAIETLLVSSSALSITAAVNTRDLKSAANQLHAMLVGQ